MDAETRKRLRSFRETVLRPVAARKAAAQEPAKDSRARFDRGPLAGKLKNPRERLEESLGLDDPQADEWLPQALELPEWRAAYEKYERLYGDAVGAEKIAARTEAGIETAARYLGLTVAEFTAMQGDPARMGELLVREHNAATRERIAALEASMRPLPEKVEPGKAAE